MINLRWFLVEPPSNFAATDSLGAKGIPSSAYLAPIIKEEGDEVEIEDAPTMDHNLNDIKRRIENFNPDFVGISAMTPSTPSAYKVANTVKDFDSDINVILGGAHPTLLPERTMEECAAVDIVVRGEGEETIRELIKARDLTDVKGITYRKDSKIVHNDPREPIMDLDKLPFPAYDMIPMERYKIGGVKYSTVMTSRGCPFNCTFCSSSKICGKIWRGKSPERVVEQLNVLTNEFDVHEIEFIDDTFTLNKERAVSICDLIVKENLDVSWSCSSRVDIIDKSLVQKLKEAGCHTVYMGIESGVQEILDRLKKGITLEQVKNAVSLTKKAGLTIVGSFIVGIPGETKKQMKKTIKFAKELNLTLAQFTVFTPYPGTEAWDIAKKNDLISTQDWSKFSTLEPVMKHSEMSEGEMSSFLTKAYISYYFRPSYIWQVLHNRYLWSLLKRGVKNLF